MGVEQATIPSVTRAAVWHGPDDLRLEEIALRAPGPGELLVRIRACGLCASETMAWYMAGKAPVALGHEPVAEVIAVGDGLDEYTPGNRLFVHHHAPCFACRPCRRGDYVHCKTWRGTKLVPGGLSEYALVPAHVVRFDTRPIPVWMGDDEATFVEPLACVVKAQRRAHLGAGDRVLVIGAGVMGLLHVLLARRRGASVIVADRVASRLRRAEALGAETIDVTKADLAPFVRGLTGGEGADVVVVGPGNPEAIDAGYRSAAPGGTVVLFTPAPPDDVWPLPVHDAYFREISVVPSYSCGPDDTAEALALLESGLSLEAEELITHRLSLDQAAYGYRLVREATDALKVVVHP
jgi:L-iditol 2-dehydrogenase